MSEKLSNVIGAPFDNYILEQLYTRAARNSNVQRSNEDILFLANKNAWARLISSVNITVGSNPDTKPLAKFYEQLGLGSTYTNPQDLARNWILEAGTSIKSGQGIALRSGIGTEGAYGLGGIEELGYRPMPGLNSVQVETVGRLGSLKQAIISFKVWNMNQLNIVEALYFRLGYSMILEWGHTQYFNNPTLTSLKGTFTSATNTFGLDDPFAVTNKTVVQQKIVKKAKETSGNYDGMLGIVSNFTWSFNQEGGYDCTVKLIGLGSIIDTVRINQSYKMPPGLIKPFKKAEQSIKEELERKEQQAKEAERQKEEQAKLKAEQELQKRFPVPQNFQELYNFAITKGGFKGTEENFRDEVSFYPSSFPDTNTINSTPDYFYLAEIESAETYNQQQLGLFLQREGKFVPLHQVLGGNIGTGGASFQISLDSTEKVARNNNAILTVFGRAGKTVEASSIRSETLYKSSLANYYNYFISQDPSVASNLLGSSRETGVTLSIDYTGRVLTEEKTFSISIKFVNSNPNYTPTLQQVLTTLDAWATNSLPNSGLLYLVNFETVTAFRTEVGDDLLITAQTPRYRITNVPYSGASRNQDVRNTPGDIEVWFEVVFDNTALISTVNTVTPSPEPVITATQQANSEDTDSTENSATASQTEATTGYESALHIMLTYIKTVSLAQTISNATKPVIAIDISEATRTFYQDGILKDVFNSVPSLQTFNTSPFNVTYYAQKGFNSNLLTEALTSKGLFEGVASVNFKELSKAYLVQYQTSNVATNAIEYPTYITLGYLLAFLNNMCLLYDSKQQIGSNTNPTGVDKTPYFYIDFNPSTNFCLTSPQHLSIDPTVCLIPFQGNNQNFVSIFPENISTALGNSVYKPQEEDFLSGQLPEFKTLDGNPYQGKTMNILLNIDFLLNVVNSYISSDSEHSINLQSFLGNILVEVNKSLGNLNLFRVAYRDDSNTVQIKDDQWVPGLSGESTIINKNAPTGPEGFRLGELPVFGQQSLARAFQFRTETSTKMGSMIAISAQAATGSINAVDASSIGYLNANYQDRFKPYIVEGTKDPNSGDAKKKVTDPKKSDESNNDLVLGEQFNTHIKSIYSNFLLDLGKIDASKNYYIERTSKDKSTDPITSAAPFIPANLELTIDGISGILMGNAFTIPESRLPLSLRGIPGKPKVGFIAVGLTHTIQENQWLTKIRGQMIKLRDANVTDSVKEVNRRQTILKRRSVSDGKVVVRGDGYPVTQSDIDFANQYTGGILPAVQLADGTFQIASIEGDRYWLQPNPDYVSKLVRVIIPLRNGSATVSVHPDLAVKLNTAFTEITNQGLQKYIVSSEGGLAVRNVTNGVALSFHAWGFAIDLNASLYGYGTNWNNLPLNDFNKGFESVATVLNKYGVGWYKTRDPMHFSIYESTSLIF